MDKPTKPSDLMPRSFGGVKNNFSASLQSSGYEDGVPAIYGGDNLNYQLDATGKELDYCEKIADYMVALPIGKTVTTDSNNKLVYETLYAPDNDSIVATNGVMTADKIKDKLFLGGVLEAPNGIATYTSTTITFKSGIKFVAANGRNANGTAQNLIATLPADITISDVSGYSKYNIIGVSSIDNGATWRADGVADFQFYVSTTTPIIDPNKGVRALWFNPDLNVWKDTADGGVTWITILFCALIRTDNDINTTGHPLTAIRDFNTVKFLSAYDSIITQLDKPDFSKKISLPFATYYYAEDDGYIYVETEIYAPAGNTIKVEAKINGNTVYASGASGHLDNTTIASGNFKVSAGDLFIIQKTVQTGVGEVINYSGYFVPVKREWV